MDKIIFADEPTPAVLYGWVGRTEKHIGPYTTDEWHYNSEILNKQGYQLNQDGNLVFSNGKIADSDIYIFDQKHQTRFKRQASRIWEFDVDMPSVRLYAVLWDQWGDHPLYNYTLKEFNQLLLNER